VSPIRGSTEPELFFFSREHSGFCPALAKILDDLELIGLQDNPGEVITTIRGFVWQTRESLPR
jgi:hypothetical protein